MNAIVTLGKGKDSILMISKKNPAQAAIMLVSVTRTTNNDGFMAKSKRVGLVKGSTEVLQELIDETGLKAGDNWSKKVEPVKLVVKESTEPFYDGQAEKIYPASHKNAGEPVTHNGEFIYRQTIVVPVTMNDVNDVLLESDRDVVEEAEHADVGEAFATQK